MKQSISLDEPIFVGRKIELTKLQKQLESTLNGKGSTVLISGVAGSGKTRILNEFLNVAREKKIVTLVGWCLSDSNVPYFPFVEAFNSYTSLYANDNPSGDSFYVSSKISSYLTESIAVESTKQELGFSLAWKDKTFQAVAKELLFISTSKPLILILEDLHWADTASLALLHYLSRVIDSERIMIVGTFRNEELAIEEDQQQLAKTLHLMGREGLFKEINLSNLTPENIDEIAKSMLKGPVDPIFIQQMYVDSRGNPLFVIESLRMLAENGDLFKAQGKWRVIGKIAVPFKVKEIILRRLEGLKPDENRVLDVASVIGDKFDANLIASTLSIDNLTVLEVLDNIFQKTFLLRVENNAFSFDHALSREVLYQKISSPLKVGYHEKIAEEMERQLPSKSFSINQIAFHYSQASNKPKAIQYSILAGKDAIARFSPLEAIKHFVCAQNLFSDNSDLETQKQILEGLGDAYYANNAFMDAIKTYELLAQISNSNIKQRALSKAMRAAFMQGDTKQIDQLVKMAEVEENLSSIEKARILHYKGVVATAQGQIQEAIKLCEESLKIFEEEYALSDLAWLLFVVADFESGQGDIEKAIAYCLRSISIFDELGDSQSIMEAYNEAGKVFLYCGLYSQAQSMFEKVLFIETKTKMGNYIMNAKANCFLSLQRNIIGDLDGAIEKNFSAIEYSNKASSPLFLPIIYSNLIKLFVKQGKIPEALEYENKLKEIFYGPKAKKDVITGVYVAQAEIFLLSAANKFEEALAKFDQLIAVFKHGFPSPILLNILLYEYAWILEKSNHISLANDVKMKINEAKLKNDEMLAKANVKAYFIIPAKINTKETFQGRLDIVNLSTISCSVDISISLPLEFTIIKYPSNAKLNQGKLTMQKCQLKPFGVQTITFSSEAKKPGKFSICSTLEFTNEQGITKTYETTQFNILARESKPEESSTVNQFSVNNDKQEIDEKQIEFESIVAEKIFNYLTKEFIRDYMQRRIVLDKSGWRSLVDIAVNEKIPISSLYGYRNQRSQALIELQHRGLVEKRFFPGERGRGGKISRLRISYDKDVIKKYVDNQIKARKKE